MFMCFLNVFIEWCNETNNSIMFNKHMSTLKDFGNLIERLHKHPTFIENVLRIKNMKTTNKFIQNTMRMSLYEMG